MAMPRLPGRRVLIGLGVAIAGVSGLSYALRAAGDSGPSETVVVAPFVVGIKGQGDLVPAERHMVAARFTAKLDNMVEEGKEVKAGDVVAKLNTQDIEEQQQEEELRQVTLVKDEEVRALTASRDSKKLLTDKRAAIDNLALKQLLLKQQVAGFPRAEITRLEILAAAAQRAYTTAAQSFHLQEGLLAKGIIRPIDLDTAKVAFAEASKAKEVTTTALAIARQGYPAPQVGVARAEVEKARNDLRLVEGRLASLARTARMDRDVAGAERAWSKARLLLNQHRLADAQIKAPSAGVVVLNTVRSNGQRKKLQVGDEARQNQAFMEIADVSKVFIKTEIKEVDIGRVHVGMPVKIHVAGLSKTFDGKLDKLGVLAYEKPNVINREGAPKVFEGLINTSEHSTAFRPGMTVDVELVAAALKSAMTVPNRALTTHNGETFVWVHVPRRANERRVVVAGEHTDERTVILKGLAAGDQVLLEAP
jgi:HlyD family secretion protein